MCVAGCLPRGNKSREAKEVGRGRLTLRLQYPSHVDRAIGGLKLAKAARQGEDFKIW